ncbi:hypothetical protein CXB51_033576 [Gossypium anomalum]|uniref:Zinc finger PMZ-type domain-containing protein n=1 Tax=Gossypium anomalum TaxID=47600 RepID=A0A8J5YAL6_9ROSI|nr:hypothetical protein CXB51_033576 [Gossypium anomalum]
MDGHFTTQRVASELWVTVNLTRYRRAKNKVIKKLVRNVKKEFALLWDYANELRSKNPGGTITMAINMVTSESPPQFKRFYICFNTLKNGCKSILGLDGYFLKGPYKGEMLPAVGRDANNQMYPVAWVVVEGECTNSWAWEWRLPMNDFLPRAKHIKCSQHEDKFAALTEKDEEVAKELRRMKLRHCTKAFFDEGQGKIDAIKKEVFGWRMFWNGDQGCKVKNGRMQYCVNIKAQTCTSRAWQLTWLPCAHAYAAIWHTIDKKMPGRPKKNRRKTNDAPKRLSKIGFIIISRICGVQGHNKVGCPGKKNVKERSDAEQPSPSQTSNQSILEVQAIEPNVRSAPPNVGSSKANRKSDKAEAEACPSQPITRSDTTQKGEGKNEAKSVKEILAKTLKPHRQGYG